MTHYICDVGVFGHVMGSGTAWGNEVHHSDFEDYVLSRTDTYIAEFNAHLVFDGALDNVSAYDATLTLAFNTTFGDNGSYDCTWMDQSYSWSNSTFKNRCGKSLDLATNLVARCPALILSKWGSSRDSGERDSAVIGDCSASRGRSI